MDCAEPAPLAEFWAQLLGGEVAFASESFVAVKADRLWLSAVKVPDYQAPTWPDGPSSKQMHLDLAVDDLAKCVDFALGLGARRAHVQPAPDRFVVLLDPAGHPFCLTTQIPE